MQLSTHALCLMTALFLLSIGCSKQPDPKANPKFNEGALMDPGSIKMGAEAPVPQPQNP